MVFFSVQRHNSIETRPSQTVAALVIQDFASIANEAVFHLLNRNVNQPIKK